MSLRVIYCSNSSILFYPVFLGYLFLFNVKDGSSGGVGLKSNKISIAYCCELHGHHCPSISCRHWFFWFVEK